MKVSRMIESAFILLLEGQLYSRHYQFVTNFG